MNLLTLAVISGFLGIALCDSLCMQLKLAECFKTLMARENKMPLCIAYDELSACIRIETTNCGMEKEPLVRGVQKIFWETCTEGTEMNELFKKHQHCVFHYTTEETIRCTAPIKMEVSDFASKAIIKDRKYTVEIVNIYCKYLDSKNECIEEGISDFCGPEAAEFQRRLRSPSTQLNKQACKDLNAESPYSESNVTETIEDFVTTVPPAYSSSIASQQLTKSPNLHVALNFAHDIDSHNLILILTVILLVKFCLHK